MTKDSVHLLFLFLSIVAAVIAPIAIFIVAPLWVIIARIQDWAANEN